MSAGSRSAETRSRCARWVGRGCIACLSLVASVGAVELAIRVLDPFGVSYYGNLVRLRGLARWSDDARLIYELAPEARDVVGGVTYRVNALGHRGPERPAHPPPGATVWLGTGDSVMFGMGVREEDGLLDQAAARTGADVLTYNTGVISFDIHQQLAVVERWAPRLGPAVHVHVFVDNDVDLPRRIAPGFRGWASVFRGRTPGDLFPWTAGWVPPPALRRVLPGIAHLSFYSWIVANERRRPAGDPHAHLLAGSAWKESRPVLERFCRESVRHARTFVFVALVPDGGLARELDAIVTPAGGHLVVPAHDASWRREDPQALRLSRADPHPSPLAHRLIAGMIAARVRRALPPETRTGSGP
jgi:hypothetical protein